MKTRAEAQKLGDAALTLLGDAGKGWHVRVWENLGWHANLVSPCGRMKVHWNTFPENGTSYIAYLGDADSPGGYWTGSASTPQAAIAKAVEAGRAELKRVQELMQGW